VLSLVQEIDIEPKFEDSDLTSTRDLGLQEARSQALWDVVFARLSGVQEYGWHSGLEKLVWITDELNGGLSEFDWGKLKSELSTTKTTITDVIIQHAKDNGEFFAHTFEREPEVEGQEF